MSTWSKLFRNTSSPDEYVTLPSGDNIRATTLTDANGAVLKTSDNGDGTSTLQVGASTAVPTAGNVLNGFGTFTATAAASTLITIPAGRTWTGRVGANVTCSVPAANSAAAGARAVFATAGAGVTPAAGTYFEVDAAAAANGATGTVGTDGSNAQSMPFVVVAPAGNAVTVTVTPTVTGSGTVNVWASGQLV